MRRKVNTRAWRGHVTAQAEAIQRRIGLSLLSRPEPLVWRGDLGDEIPDQGFLRQRPKGRHAFLQSDRAGVIDPAVDQHHAFLAGVGVNAGEPKRKRRIELAPKRAQAVEHGLAMLERNLEAFDAWRFAGRAALDGTSICRR